MFFDIIRSTLCPFNKIETFIPKVGKILDVGCGNGIFCELLIKKSMKRRVIGIDPSDHKIKLAKQKIEGVKNIQFKKSFLKDINGYFNCISVIDVLYLFSPNEKIKLLKKANQLLKKNGSLILVEVSSEPRFLYNLIKLEEYFMVKTLKYTYSKTRDLFFQPNSQYIKLLKEAGFKNIKTENIQGISPYPKHILFIGYK